MWTRSPRRCTAVGPFTRSHSIRLRCRGRFRTFTLSGGTHVLSVCVELQEPVPHVSSLTSTLLRLPRSSPTSAVNGVSKYIIECLSNKTGS